jgi:hypothetical protein
MQVGNRYYPVIIARKAGSQYEIKIPIAGCLPSYTKPQAAETYTKRARKEQG